MTGQSAASQANPKTVAPDARAGLTDDGLRALAVAFTEVERERASRAIEINNRGDHLNGVDQRVVALAEEMLSAGSPTRTLSLTVPIDRVVARAAFARDEGQPIE